MDIKDIYNLDNLQKLMRYTELLQGYNTKSTSNEACGACGGVCYVGDGFVPCDAKCHDCGQGVCTTLGEASCESCAGCVQCVSCNSACYTGNCDCPYWPDPCLITCQICNTSQSKCAVGGQSVSADRWGLGKFNYVSSELNASVYEKKSYSANDVVVYNNNLYICKQNISAEDWNSNHWNLLQITPTKQVDWNALVNYINSASTIAAITLSDKPSSVNASQLLKCKDFDAVNKSINQFLNCSTELPSKSSGSKAVVSDLIIFRKQVNNATIADTVPCCEHSGYESCITKQK